MARASRTPSALAVAGPDESLTYGRLDQLANQISHALVEHGVGPGDRVAIWLEKSAVAVAAMQAVLRAGAAYVPLDPLSPVSRGRMILSDCTVSVLITVRKRAEQALTGDLEELPCLCVDDRWRGMSWREVLNRSGERLPDPPGDEGDLAYILYTSGSMGRPKGVSISHRNALAFTCWAEEVLAANPEDRFSSHAPFHFDLSVLDLYVAFQAGASVHLIPDGLSFAAARLVDFLTESKLTVWYSVPSVLILMMEHGKLLELPKLSLRALLFAGETFPVKYLRRLRKRWPSLRLLNLYGPTETNVCTFFEVGELDPDRASPVPIGCACSNDRVWARKDDGSSAGAGEIGELIVSGPTVMLGYWGREPQGDEPYETGDLVRALDGGGFEFVGRRDHMVKVRGHRLELGEIEAALQQHPAIRETAVLVRGSGLEARLIAFIDCSSDDRPSLIGLKIHLADRVPRHMIIDGIRYLDGLPKTRTGKIDRRELARRLESRP